MWDFRLRYDDEDGGGGEEEDWIPLTTCGNDRRGGGGNACTLTFVIGGQKGRLAGMLGDRVTRSGREAGVVPWGGRVRRGPTEQEGGPAPSPLEGEGGG